MTYKGTPASLYLEAELLPAVTAPGSASQKQMSEAGRTKGATTAPTSIAKANAHTDALVREIEDCARRGDGERLHSIFSDNPAIALVSRAGDILLSWIDKARFRAGRGRPRRTGTYHPIVVYGLVRRLLEAGTVQNPEQAFHWLAEHAGIAYTAAKGLYYQVIREERFRGVIVEHHENPCETNAELERALKSARVLQPGDEVIATRSHPDRGNEELRIQVIE